MNKVAVNGVLVALALIFSYLEKLIGIGFLIPVPGIKLGLANIVTIVALFFLGTRSAVIITVLRCVISNLLFGSIISMTFALSGAFLALTIMIVLKTGYGSVFSLIGISAAGAAAHNIGQIIAASFVLNSTAVFSYLPLLLVASIFTGILTGSIAIGVLDKLKTARINQGF